MNTARAYPNTTVSVSMNILYSMSSDILSHMWINEITYSKFKWIIYTVMY